MVYHFNSFHIVLLFIYFNVLFCYGERRVTKSSDYKSNFRNPLLKNSQQWTLQPSAPWVLTGGSVMLQFQPPQMIKTSKNTPKVQCTVTAPGSLTNFTLLSSDAVKEFVLQDANTDKLKIGRTAEGGCYTLHSSVSSISNGNWRITVNENEFTAATNIIVVALPSASATVTTSIGRLATISCSSSTSVTLSYCQILNNTGHAVSHECFYSINPVRKEHVGNWTCLMAFRGTMEDVKHVVSLVLQDDDYLDGKVFTEGNKTHLQCTMRNSATRFNWCRATSPKGESFLLSPGIVHGKYSATGSSADDRICNLVIESASSADHGLWRIELGISANDYTGCFLSLPQNNVDQLPPLMMEPSNAVVKVGENLRLECNVPWPSAYCYAIKPDGTPIRQLNGDRLLRIGVCIVTATNLSMEDTGRWTCGLSANDGTEDIHFYTDVEVMSGQLSAAQAGLTLQSGSEATLLCRSPLHQPLRYCRFTNPQGKGFLLRPNIYPESRFSYYGAGLNEGECGVRISEVLNEDVGTWICAATFVSFSVEEYATVTITKLEASTSFKVGIGIISGAAIIILLTLSTIVYRKRQARLSDERRRILRETPANSQETISNNEEILGTTNGVISEHHHVEVDENGRMTYAPIRPTLRVIPYGESH